MKKLLRRSYIIGPLAMFIAVLVIVININQDKVGEMYDRENEIEEIIRQYAVACYAQEGAYPKDIRYLEENYGLIIDEAKYYYYYDLFASNLMPDIEVIAVGKVR